MSSILSFASAYFVAIGLGRGCNQTLNVGMAQMFGELLFFFISSFSLFYLSFLEAIVQII